MEEIEVVIKIPKILYAQIQSDAEIMIYSGMRSWKGILATLLRSVRNGTPLPKGHGRLIDADEVDDAIYKCFEGIQCYDGTGYDIYSNSKESINKIPTIIEADKGDGGNEKIHSRFRD